MEKIGIGKELMENKENFEKHVTDICSKNCKGKYNSEKKIEECIESCKNTIAMF